MYRAFRRTRVLASTLSLPVIPVLIGTLAFVACQPKHTDVKPDAAFTPFISAFTAGHIPARSAILVRISDGQSYRDSSAEAINKLFELDPSVEGTVSWSDHQTLAFQPAQRLQQDQVYSVTLRLGQLINLPANLGDFKFQVTTFAQGIDVKVDDMRPVSPADLTWQRVYAGVYTSDFADGAELEKCVTAEQNGRTLKLLWEHEPNGNFHRAMADSVQRGETASSVMFRWNSEAIGGKDNGERPWTVPAVGDLQLIGHETFSEGEQYASLLFSDPLDPAQNLEGLAGIAGVESVRLSVDGNKLLMYPGTRLSGTQSAFVAAGLMNINQRKLGKDITIADLTFEEVKPNVRISGSGTILPSTDGLLFPFEAVNLNAVDVRVVRIYADNVPQFLQVNDLAGERELARVGRIILRKSIPLTGKEKSVQGKWTTYFLDLDELIKTEPGAIYRISLGYRRSYSTYPCPDSDKNAIALTENDNDEDLDDGQWDNPGRDYWYYDEGEGYEYEEEYNYQEREQPCSPSYFRNKQTVVERNILASDIGLIAKRGNDGSLLVAASDLRTAQPMSGVKVDVLDAQHKSIGAPLTDGEGLITLPTNKRKPFLIVATKGNQRGYLKLDDGSSLNVSAYEVEGESVNKGLKGLLYGERGVWRPGDSLYLTFILQDLQHKLPKDHPVVLELSDPKGRLDQRIVRTNGVDGTYAFRCATDVDAPTGNWSALVRVGGTSFYKQIRIETVKPNRLKILLDFGGGSGSEAGSRLTTENKDRKVKLQSNWLHGAPARELKTRTTVTLTRSNAEFKGYEKFIFNDLNNDLNTEEITVFDGTLNADGHTEFPFDLNLNNKSPAAVNANIVTRVFEAGGDASTDRTDAVYYPYSAYAGMKIPDASSYWGTYRTDSTYTIIAAALDPNGKPLANHALKAQVVKVSYNWWWSGDMDGSNSYMNAPSSTILGEQDLKTDAKGRTTFTFRVDRPNWGRYVVRLSDPASGHVSAAELYLDWPGYEGRSRRQDGKAAAMLTFNSDKEKYAVGDVCTLTIPSGGTGRAFISLETGSRILDAKWVELKEKETKFNFPVTAEMAPNIYAHVMLIQPHAKAVNDLPIRLYGVIPIHVEDAQTHLKPVITMAKEIKTDEPFSVEVSEASGEALTYTLAIVDEGLLDLTRFKTPDPWNVFYAKEALGVRTWDLYDHVIGAFGRQLQRVLALGGSDQASPDAAAKANRFKPVVRFVGPLKLAKGQKAQHSFTISNYVGSVRVMVVVNDGDRAFGSSEKTVQVKKPLMLLATLPRVVGPGETVDLPVTVFAMDAKVKNVQLKLDANDFFAVEGSNTLALTFQKTGDQVAVFRVKMAERIGVGKVKLTVEGAGERATQTIEIAVRQPNLPQTDQTEGVVDAGKSWEDTPKPVGILGTNSAYLEVSTIPAVDLGYRLKYLIDYPHGCIEQTTSAAFPQLFLANVIDVDARTAQEMRANVEAGLHRLRLFQQPNGGFSYWPGEDGVNDWGTNYAGHFLIEADRAGYKVPVNMKTKWIAYMRSAVRDWSPNSDGGWSYDGRQLTQAYRLYVLALANAADQAAMNRLRTDPKLGAEAKWMLAAAYALSNNKKVAKELVAGLSSTVSPYREMSYTYGSDLRDEAIIAEAMLLMDDRTTGAIVIKRIAENLGTDGWYSTQSTAWGLLAISRLATADELGKGVNIAVNVNGKVENRMSKKSVMRIELPVPDGKKKVSVTNTGKGLLYVRTVRTGTPMPGAESPASNGLAADVRYQRMDGTMLDPATLEQGTDFQAVVTIQHPGIRGDYQEMALTQVFPSGWEIRNSRLEGTESAQQNSWFQYQDIRDDRVMTYFSIGSRQQATYRVFLNASYIGRFYLPPTVCEAMYDNTVNARSPGRWVTVAKAGEGRAAK